MNFGVFRFYHGTCQESFLCIKVHKVFNLTSGRSACEGDKAL
jgi:hypothetical protein